jgi:hypothetical protein
MHFRDCVVPSMIHFRTSARLHPEMVSRLAPDTLAWEQLQIRFRHSFRHTSLLSFFDTFPGLGLSLEGNAPVTVKSVVAAEAAASANVKTGDRIFEINGTCVLTKTHREVTALIKASVADKGEVELMLLPVQKDLTFPQKNYLPKALSATPRPFPYRIDDYGFEVPEEDSEEPVRESHVHDERRWLEFFQKCNQENFTGEIWVMPPDFNPVPFGSSPQRQQSHTPPMASPSPAASRSSSSASPGPGRASPSTAPVYHPQPRSESTGAAASCVFYDANVNFLDRPLLPLPNTETFKVRTQ